MMNRNIKISLFNSPFPSKIKTMKNGTSFCHFLTFVFLDKDYVFFLTQIAILIFHPNKIRERSSLKVEKEQEIHRVKWSRPIFGGWKLRNQEFEHLLYNGEDVYEIQCCSAIIGFIWTSIQCWWKKFSPNQNVKVTVPIQRYWKKSTGHIPVPTSLFQFNSLNKTYQNNQLHLYIP